MRNCHKCGFPLSENDQFCKTCGAEILKTAPVTPSVQPAMQQTPSVQPAMQQTPSVQPAMQQTPSVQPAMQQTPSVQPAMQQAPSAQPAMQQAPMMPSYNNQKPKGNNVILIVMALVIIVLGGLLGYSLLNKDTKETEEVVENTYSINFKKFEFKAPQTMIYREEAGKGYLTDIDETWIAVLESSEGSFEKLKKNKEQIIPSYKQKGYEATNLKIQDINKIEFVTLEVDSAGTNVLLAVTKLNPTNLIAVSLYTESNEFDYETLEKIAAVIKTAKYAPTNNAVIDNMPDFDIINKIGE